jgi:hypothetical protein
MKRFTQVLIPLILLCAVFSACSIGQAAREQKTADWIETAAKPIKVIYHDPWTNFTATGGNRFYTLIDRNGKTYLAKNIRFQLPPVIE